jgi:hypothetical protein
MGPQSHSGGAPPDRFQYRFGVVFILILTTFVFLAAAPTGAWARPVTVALQGATLVAALSAAGVPRRLVRASVLVTIVAFVATVATMSVGGAAPGGLVALLNALLVATAPVAIAWSILRRGVIDVRTVLGALCIYVLLGMFWAFVFTAVGAFAPDPFFAQLSDPTSADYQYFSFVTQTTVGYGDLTAGGNFPRAIVVLEALLGQIYLVTVVALLVSNLGRGRGARAHERS